MSRLGRRDLICQCAGGAGAVVSCAAMIISLAAGLAGAAGSAAIRRGAMAGMGSMSSSATAPTRLPWLAAVMPLLNRIAVPLLIVSVLLMLAGAARAGWRAVGLVALGSALLLVNMFVSTSTVEAAWLLGGGYALICVGYVIAWRRVKIDQTVISDATAPASGADS